MVATSQHAMIKPTTCGRVRGVRSRPKPRPPGALALGTGLSARGRALAHAIGASARAASRRQTRGDAAARRTPSSCRLRGFNGTPEAPPCAPILRTRRRRARTHTVSSKHAPAGAPPRARAPDAPRTHGGGRPDRGASARVSSAAIGAPQRSLARSPPPHPPRSLEKGVRRSSNRTRME